MRRTRWQRKVAGWAGALVFPFMLSAPLQGVAAEAEPADPYQQKVEELAQELRDVSAEEQAESQVSEEQLEQPQSGSKPVVARTFATRALGTLDGPLSLPGISQGQGYYWYYYLGHGLEHWLGAFDVAGRAEWCIDFIAPTPSGPGASRAVSVQQIPSGVSRASGLQLQDNYQMAYVLSKYGTQADAGVRAAVSTLAHLNFELGEGRGHLGEFMATLTGSGSAAGPIIAEMAQTMAADAKANTPSYVSGQARFKVSESRQTFELLELGVQAMPTGAWTAGVDMTVVLTGPAVFDKGSTAGGTLSADGKTWKGKTKSSAITLSGKSTANGTVKAKVTFGSVATQSALGAFGRSDGTQTTITQVPGTRAVLSAPEPTEELLYDFQPMLTSSTEDAGAKFIEPGQGVIADSLDVQADPAYSNPLWLGEGGALPGQDGYVPLKVKFVGTAYYTGQRPASQAGSVPSDAKAVAQAELVAVGPGTYRVETDYDGDPGFIVWVWKMDAGAQPQIAREDAHMIAGDWSDGYGVAAEHSVLRYEGKVESNLTVKPTIDNTYMVDDVWISGLPEDHPTFPGAAGYGPDTKTIEQRLYFWPEGVEVRDLDDAIQVGDTLTIPAKNGVYLGQADLSWKLLRDEADRPTRGTYQVVHSFGGDDRVMPLLSTIPDVTEQYTITGNPQLGTTATGPENKKVIPAVKEATIKDTVCYLDLKPGTEYTLKGKLMDATSGKELLSKGKEVTSNLVFTPESADGCVDMEFSFDSTALHGTTTVVFEELWEKDKQVTVHADIKDRGQTVSIEASPGPKSSSRGQLAKTGADTGIFWALGAVAVASGAALTLGVRRSRR